MNNKNGSDEAAVAALGALLGTLAYSRTPREQLALSRLFVTRVNGTIFCALQY